MAHISNFKRFKILLENNNLNYKSINESKYNEGGAVREPGSKIQRSTSSSDSYDGIKTYGPGEVNVFSDGTEANALDAAIRCFGTTAMPGFRVGSTSVNSDTEVSNIYRALIGGAAIMSGNGDKLDGGDTDIDKYTDGFAAKSSKVGSIKLFGDGKLVDTMGAMTSNYINTKKGKLGKSSLINLCGYLNGFNLRNWVVGSGIQYDPNKILNDNNRADLTAQGNSTIDETGFLYLVSAKEFVAGKGSREDVETITQGEEAKSGAVEVSFGNMKYAVDPTNPKVKEIGDKIKSYLGDKGTIKAITITSSASPSWNGAKTGVSNGTNEPGGGKLTSANFASETSELGNQYLAYLRGRSFENALHAYLGDAYPKNANTTIAWKVSTDQPGNGKHIKYTVTTRGQAPQTIKKTEFQSGGGEAKGGNFELVVYKVTFKNSTFAGEGEGKKTPFLSLKEGDKVKIYAMKGEKINKLKKAEVEITKVEDNKVYYSYQGGEEKELDKARYASFVPGAKAQNEF